MSARRNYIIRRVMHGFLALFIIATLLFFLFRLGLPDPTAALITEGLTPAEREQIRARFGLERPLWEQYLIYLGNIVQGDFGFSFHYRAPVADIIWERLGNTMVLMLPAIALAYAVGVPLGAWLSWRRGSGTDTTGIFVGLMFRSAPMFWTGMIAILFFGIYLGWLPTSGMRTLPYEASGFLDKIFTLDFLHHLILPALVVALYYLGSPMLIMRNTMLEVYGEDFIEMARAKGLPERRILYNHAARNALLPVVTQLAVTIGLAAGGQVVVEVVFSWPGLGREILNAVRTSDFPLAQASFLVMAAFVITLNLLVDMLYTLLDPRVSFK
ncbi:ABC transporter permease [Natronospirillum operosum]|uniref:ABC transporter permease n=1 Tax=Natronospirillum operosum TaxID=2759953 RepID=A0A4Z0WHW9_9GAMM|nr:ABC transporter permease [Natronospirillum operosum]TGG95336.1 ABC transporter permease [Natronospirillum operosum]